jgi:type I restriction enzyme S subunit
MTERTLEDLCNILPRSKRNTKYGSKEGAFPFFRGTAVVDSFVDTPDYLGESIIIGDGGAANINYCYEFSASDNCFILQNKNKSILNLKYAYYYLSNNLDIMNNLYTGSGDTVSQPLSVHQPLSFRQPLAVRHLSKSSLKNITIPVHSLDKQYEIVEYCENNENNIKELEKEIVENRKRMAQYMKDSKKIIEFWKI